MRFDMTPKPALGVLKKLFTEEWHTEKNIVADDGGRARFKGFYGNYDITVHADGREITVPAHLEKYTGNPLVFTVKI